MKNVLFLFCFFILLLFTSCSNKKKTIINSVDSCTVTHVQANSLSENLSEDSDTMEKKACPDLPADTTAIEVFHEESESVDSIIGNYQLSYVIKDNKDTVTNIITYKASGNIRKTLYADRSVYLTIKNKGKTILHNKEINKYLFKKFFEDEITKYQLWYFGIERVSNDIIVFNINACIPDTDLCYTFNLSVSNDGSLSTELSDEDDMFE